MPWHRRVRRIHSLSNWGIRFQATSPRCSDSSKNEGRHKRLRLVQVVDRDVLSRVPRLTSRGCFLATRNGPRHRLTRPDRHTDFRCPPVPHGPNAKNDRVWNRWGAIHMRSRTDGSMVRRGRSANGDDSEPRVRVYRAASIASACAQTKSPQHETPAPANCRSGRITVYRIGSRQRDAVTTGTSRSRKGA